jgi:hypothetical protein
VEFKDLLLSFGDIAGRADGSNRTAEQVNLPFQRYTSRVSLILQQGGFEANTSRLFAEALAENQAFTRQIFAAHMAKLSRELRALCLAWWWSAGIILAGVAGLEVLFRLH